MQQENDGDVSEGGGDEATGRIVVGLARVKRAGSFP